MHSHPRSKRSLCSRKDRDEAMVCLNLKAQCLDVSDWTGVGLRDGERENGGVRRLPWSAELEGAE